MKIGVAVLTYSRAASLERCLQALSADTAGRDDFSVLVIDNAGQAEVKRIAGKFGAGYIADTKRSKGYLRNLGWKTLKTDIIVYIDDDAEVCRGWSQNIRELFSNQAISAATGPCIVRGGQFMLEAYRRSRQNQLIHFLFGLYNRLACENNLLAIGRFFPSGAYSIGGSLEQSARLGAPLEIEIMSSCNMALRRAVLEATNGFDEGFIYNHEDGDLSLRIRKAGYRLIFAPGMSVVHNLNPSRNTRSSAYYIGRDFGRFYAKHIRISSAGALPGFFINILMLNFYWFYEMFRGIRPEPLFGISGFISGFKSGRGGRC